MKKLCNASAIAAFLTAVCFTAVSCNKTPSESTLPVEKELGVSIELTSATETSVSVDITAEKDAEGYIYAIGEAGKLNEFQNGTMEGIQTQNDPTVKSASFDGLTKATDYTIYAQAFAGEEKGNVRQLVVTTEGEPDFDLTTTTTIDNALMVPISAVQSDGAGGSFVMVVTDPETQDVAQRKVEVVASDGLTSVVKGALKPGDQVVAGGMEGLGGAGGGYAVADGSSGMGMAVSDVSAG